MLTTALTASLQHASREGFDESDQFVAISFLLIGPQVGPLKQTKEFLDHRKHWAGVDRRKWVVGWGSL